MTPKLELGRDFRTIHLPPIFIILCLFVRKLSCRQTNKPTSTQTNKQTPLKTSNAGLRHWVNSLYTLRSCEEYNEDERSSREQHNKRNKAQSIEYGSCQHPVSFHLNITVRSLSLFIVHRDPRLEQIQYTCQRLIV